MIRKIIPAVFSLLLPVMFSNSTAAAAPGGEMRAAVKVTSDASQAEDAHSWVSDPIRETSGTGFVIEGKRILTCAHVLGGRDHIIVMRDGDVRRYRASVRYVSPDADLAIVVPDDAAFFSGMQPLRFGDMPRRHDQVQVVGFRAGSTKPLPLPGVVTSVTVRPSTRFGVPLLSAQIDAALPAGFSGAPALFGDQVVGVAVLETRDAAGTGILLPADIVRQFLEDIADLRVDGNPLPRMFTAALVDPELRRSRRLDPGGEVGVLVTAVEPDYATLSGLRAGDVIVAINDVPVHADGSVRSGGERVFYTHLFAIKQAGDPVTVTVLRRGGTKQLRYPAQSGALESIVRR